MRRNTKLEPWQVLGVAKLLEMRETKRKSGRPMQRGAFLADVMGLGKTFEAIAYILEVRTGIFDKWVRNPFCERLF